MIGVWGWLFLIRINWPHRWWNCFIDYHIFMHGQSNDDSFCFYYYFSFASVLCCSFVVAVIIIRNRFSHMMNIERIILWIPKKKKYKHVDAFELTTPISISIYCHITIMSESVCIGKKREFNFGVCCCWFFLLVLSFHIIHITSSFMKHEAISFFLFFILALLANSCWFETKKKKTSVQKQKRKIKMEIELLPSFHSIPIPISFSPAPAVYFDFISNPFYCCDFFSTFFFFFIQWFAFQQYAFVSPILPVCFKEWDRFLYIL